MSEIERFTGNPSAQLSRGHSKALAGKLAEIQAGSAIGTAEIRAAVQSRETVIEGLTALTGLAMDHVAMVAQRENQLAQAVPMASGRLQALGDVHQMALSGVIMDTARALGRLT